MNLLPARRRSVASAYRTGLTLLPGELPQVGWAGPGADPLLVTIEQTAMRELATRALAAGAAGVTAVGVTAAQHGEGTTSVARSLAVCLAASFGKRVVLVEANQRTPSLRRVFSLADGPGLEDVVSRRASLGGALHMGGEHRQVLVLPAALREGAVIEAAALKEVLTALLGHADAVVVDLAPVLPYRDTGLICGALDGVGLVVRSEAATVEDGKLAVAGLREAGVSVLGAVLNRERAVVTRYLERAF